MDKQLITRRLAEKIGWEVKGNFKKNTIPSYYLGNKFIMYVGDFDPLTHIAHIRMVEDAILGLGKTQDYAEMLNKIVLGSVPFLQLDLDDVFSIAHATPEQRTEAAARALFTAEELIECGL